MRGNVMDMAVGVVIGGAFKGIVDSLVNDLLNPLLGLFGNQDLSGYELVVWNTSFRVGAFLTAVINFIIMAFVVFLLIKAINRLHSLALRKAEGVILGRRKGSITKLRLLIDHEPDIIERLARGESIRSICRGYGVSTDTFLKLRKLSPRVECAFRYKQLPAPE